MRIAIVASRTMHFSSSEVYLTMRRRDIPSASCVQHLHLAQGALSAHSLPSLISGANENIISASRAPLRKLDRDLHVLTRYIESMVRSYWKGKQNIDHVD